MTNVRDYLNEGDIVQVLIKGRDAKGRLDLSIKDLTPAPEGGAPPPRPRRLPKQSPEFENKLKSFLRGTGGFWGQGQKGRPEEALKAEEGAPGALSSPGFAVE